MSTNLTFINLSGSNSRIIGKDVDTKARVRSEVMKNVRRKQRLEDKRKYEESLRATGDQQIQSMSSGRSETSDQCTNSTRSNSAEASSASSTEDSLVMSLAAKSKMAPPKGLTLAPAAKCWRSEPAPLAHIEKSPRYNRVYIKQQEQQQEVLKVMPDKEKILLPLPFFGSQIGDSVSSTLAPQEFSQLLSTMEAYSKLLAEPLSLMRNHPRRIIKSQRTMFQQCFEHHAFDELILFTIRLTHLGHTTAISYRPENVPICVLAKAKALAQIQHHISTTMEMPPIPLLGAIMFLLSFEIIRGSSAVAIHLAGLARLVKLRGGLTFLPDSPYAFVPGLIACDLTLAATTPCMVTTFVHMDPPRLTGEQDNKYTDFYQSSPLMRFEDFQGVRRLYKGVPYVFIDILEEAFQGTWQNLATTGGLSSTPPDMGKHHMNHESSKVETAQNPPIALPFVVAEACNVAGTIYYRATRRKIPFEDPVNLDDSKRLGAFLNSASLEVWRGIPYIYLWVILTGAAAAQCHPERQYLVARLIQFGFSVGLEQEEHFKQIVLNFVWLRHKLRT